MTRDRGEDRPDQPRDQARGGGRHRRQLVSAIGAGVEAATRGLVVERIVAAEDLVGQGAGGPEVGLVIVNGGEGPRPRTGDLGGHEGHVAAPVGVGAGKGQPQLVVRIREAAAKVCDCLLYTSPSPRDGLLSRMPSSA